EIGVDGHANVIVSRPGEVMLTIGESQFIVNGPRCTAPTVRTSQTASLKLMLRPSASTPVTLPTMTLTTVVCPTALMTAFEGRVTMAPSAADAAVKKKASAPTTISTPHLRARALQNPIPHSSELATCHPASGHSKKSPQPCRQLAHRSQVNIRATPPQSIPKSRSAVKIRR